MPYKNKEQYNAYLRDYMRKRRAVKPDDVKPSVNPEVLNPVEYETIVIGGTPFRCKVPQ